MDRIPLNDSRKKFFKKFSTGLKVKWKDPFDIHISSNSGRGVLLQVKDVFFVYDYKLKTVIEVKEIEVETTKLIANISALFDMDLDLNEPKAREYIFDHRDDVYFAIDEWGEGFFGKIVGVEGDCICLEDITSYRKPVRVRRVFQNYEMAGNFKRKNRPEEKASKGYNKSIRSKDMMEIDLGQIVGLKMLNSITKGQDLDLGKLMLVQSLAGGQPIEIGDVMKAKLMSAIAKDDNSLEDLSLDKLMLYKMFDSGSIDINQIIQLKFMTKLLDEEEKK